jgi:hypothetical protein
VAVTPFLHRGADVQPRSTRIGHRDKGWKEETLDEVTSDGAVMMV